MAQSNSQYIEGHGKVVLVLEQSDFSALNSLLYELAEQPEKIRAIAREHTMALGGNEVESLSTLWNTLHKIPLKEQVNRE